MDGGRAGQEIMHVIKPCVSLFVHKSNSQTEMCQHQLNGNSVSLYLFSIQ